MFDAGQQLTCFDVVADAEIDGEALHQPSARGWTVVSAMACKLPGKLISWALSRRLGVLTSTEGIVSLSG